MARRVLVTGASISGCATAWWLDKFGFDVVVVEKAPAFRNGGQNIDIRGAGREVLKKMGLEQIALQSGTGEQGTAWIGEGGTIVAQFDQDGTANDGPTAEMEICAVTWRAFFMITPKTEPSTGSAGRSLPLRIIPVKPL